MEKKYFLLLMIFFPFSGCIKEKITISYSSFNNKTPYSISVFAYKNGNVQNEVSFTLTPNETKRISTVSAGGIGSGISFGEIYYPMDSFIVVFDNAYSISHYKQNIVGSNLKKYLFTSSRNIYNKANYTILMITNSKFKREWNYEYIFNEQDYLDAK